MTNYISTKEYADRLVSGRISKEKKMKTYTLEIKTLDTEGKLQHIRTLFFESDNGAEDIQKEIEHYQELGLRYTAELQQTKEKNFRLIYTEKQDA